MEVKGRKAEIAGIEAEIVQYQEKHDSLTSVERRTERLCASRQAQIRSVEETLEELKRALERQVFLKSDLLLTELTELT